MATTSKGKRVSDRELFYFRQRQKNRIFQAVIAFFADRAERYGLTKAAIADALGKERSQITRWFSAPGNLELDTISDLLLAMDAEGDFSIVPLHEPEAHASNVITAAQIKGARAEPASITQQPTRLNRATIS